MSRSPGRIIKSYALTAERPRALTRESADLLDIREEIFALLKPEPSEEAAAA